MSGGISLGVTGGSGFIGRSLLEGFAAKPDVRVVALTRTLPVTHPTKSLERVEWRQGDLSSRRDCARFVYGLDTILHLAHTNTPLTSNDDLPSDVMMNLVTTATLLQAVREVGTRPHIVFASSGGALYEPSLDRAPLTEESPRRPLTSYGVVKQAVEEYLRMGVAQQWFSTTVLRIGNAYGTLLPSERLQGFIGVAVQQCLLGRPVRVFGDLENVRDYLHLDDLLRAFEAAVALRRDGFEIYNVGSGSGASVLDVLEMLARLAGRPIEIDPVEPPGDATRLASWVVLDCTKALRELGWRAEIALEDGLRRMWEGTNQQ